MTSLYMNDLISVIVPVYNVEKCLHKCIDSILAQSYTPVEILLINDGSTDQSPEICNAYEQRFEKVHVIHQKNSGPSIARNTGIDVAKGRFIAFVDSDDIVHPTLLEQLKKDMDTFSVSISMCSFYKFYKEQRLADVAKLFSKTEVLTDMQAMNLLLDRQDLCAPWGKLYNKTVFDNLRFPVDRLYEDMMTLPLLFKASGRVTMNVAELYFYNQEGVSITRSVYSPKKIADLIDASHFWMDFSAKSYPALANKARLHHFANLVNLSIQIKKANDPAAVALFKASENEIFKNFFYLLFSIGFRWQDKFKVVMMRLGLLKTLASTRY